MHQLKGRFKSVLEHALVFAGDLMPYGVVFLMTLMIGFGLGLESAGFFSVTYVYVAIVTGLVCGPNLLSIRRRMPDATSPGAVVFASLGLRIAVISVGTLVVMGILYATQSKAGMLSLAMILFLGRFFETAVDGPATSVQYLRGARAYFVLRSVVFVVICGFTGIGVFAGGGRGLHWIAACYLIGSALGLAFSLASSYSLLKPIVGISAETNAQAAEFGKFFVATVLFLAASRLHPVIISHFYGVAAAGQFAMVQNLFSALAVASTGIAGVFFWSRNRKGAGEHQAGVPWYWLAGSIIGGMALGTAGGAVLDFFYLRPLGSSEELRMVGWMLCLSTPLMLVQAILSNQLVLLKRDREMLGLSALNATLGLVLITVLVHQFGLIGAALSVGMIASLSSIIGIYVIRRIHE